MAFCKKCGQQVKDANVKKFHLYEYRSKLEFNCCYCSDCYEQLLDLGYIICNHCGNLTSCIGLYSNLCTAIETDDLGNSKTVYVCCPVAECSNNLVVTRWGRDIYDDDSMADIARGVVDLDDLEQA